MKWRAEWSGGADEGRQPKNNFFYTLLWSLMLSMPMIAPMPRWMISAPWRWWSHPASLPWPGSSSARPWHLPAMRIGEDHQLGSRTTTCAHSSKMTDPQNSWFSLALVDQLGKKKLGTSTGHWCPTVHWHTHNCPYPGGKMSEATATWSSIVFWLVNYPHSCWLVSPFFKRLFQTKVHYIL